MPDALPGSALVPSAEIQTALANISQFAPSVFAEAHAAAVARDDAERARRAAVAAALRATDGAQELTIPAPEPRGRDAAPDELTAAINNPWSY